MSKSRHAADLSEQKCVWFRHPFHVRCPILKAGRRSKNSDLHQDSLNRRLFSDGLHQRSHAGQVGVRYQILAILGCLLLKPVQPNEVESHLDQSRPTPLQAVREARPRTALSGCIRISRDQHDRHGSLRCLGHCCLPDMRKAMWLSRRQWMRQSENCPRRWQNHRGWSSG